MPRTTNPILWILLYGPSIFLVQNAHSPVKSLQYHNPQVAHPTRLVKNHMNNKEQSSIFQILRDIREVRGLQARPCQAEEAEAAAGDPGHLARAAGRHPHAARRPRAGGEAGQAGAAQECAGDVSVPPF